MTPANALTFDAAVYSARLVTQCLRAAPRNNRLVTRLA